MLSLLKHCTLLWWYLQTGSPSSRTRSTTLLRAEVTADGMCDTQTHLGVSLSCSSSWGGARSLLLITTTLSANLMTRVSESPRLHVTCRIQPFPLRYLCPARAPFLAEATQGCQHRDILHMHKEQQPEPRNSWCVPVNLPSSAPARADELKAAQKRKARWAQY